jgi:hypothetical protein
MTLHRHKVDDGAKMAVSLCTCLQGGRLRMGVPMMLVSVPLTRGRVNISSLPTATAMEQPRALPLTEVTPCLRFNRKNYKTIRNPDCTKTEIRAKGGRRLPYTGRAGGESDIGLWLL